MIAKEEFYKTIIQFHQEGRKLDAVRAVVYATGLGLVRSKDTVDEFWHHKKLTVEILKPFLENDIDMIRYSRMNEPEHTPKDPILPKKEILKKVRSYPDEYTDISTKKVIIIHKGIPLKDKYFDDESAAKKFLKMYIHKDIRPIEKDIFVVPQTNAKYTLFTIYLHDS